MKIVLVEDDEMLRRSLAFFLRSNKFEVSDFDNGLDAIEFIGTNCKDINLVITDLNLPFAGGQQVIQQCRSVKEHSIKTIVLTSSGVEETEVEMFNLGADEFMAKPFSPAVLLKRIQKLLA